MTAPPRQTFWVPATRWLLLGSLLFSIQVACVWGPAADTPPVVGDIAETFNIGWELAHGRGYRFDWNDPACRELWARHDTDGQLRIITVRRGEHITLSRPPLMPLAMAAMLVLHPARPFLTWRLIDAALFSAAATLLTQGVLRRFGWRAALVLLAMLLLDPLRIDFIPGLWTEGLAFDLVAVLVWMALHDRRGGLAWVLLGGVTLGLLCLDRSFFVVVLPLLCGVLAMGTRPWWKAALAIFAVAVALQVPWWTRNVIVAGEFLPLGTQGGINLPDEYSTEAVYRRGLWTGLAMTRTWAATATTAAERSARSTPDVLALWPTRRNWAALLHAIDCQSLQTELAVADLGQHAGLAWIRAHPSLLPKLFVDKLVTQTIEHRGWLSVLSVLGGGTLLADAPRRRAASRVALLVVIYALGIGLTHAVVDRFLVPVLPPLYVLAAAGAGEALRRVTTAR